ncbi:unnamed protein product [Polarella glacialis]|uniref:Uncharacterized protein n=1 Tax=Polarella glacialis TaxID=89957 RepID=A0A813GZN1_POLGL|nr:unnamed protein product [Polarella glacialis]
MHDLDAAQHLRRLEAGSGSDALPKQSRVAGTATSTDVSKASEPCNSRGFIMQRSTFAGLCCLGPNGCSKEAHRAGIDNTQDGRHMGGVVPCARREGRPTCSEALMAQAAAFMRGSCKETWGRHNWTPAFCWSQLTGFSCKLSDASKLGRAESLHNACFMPKEDSRPFSPCMLEW